MTTEGLTKKQKAALKFLHHLPSGFPGLLRFVSKASLRNLIRRGLAYCEEGGSGRDYETTVLNGYGIEIADHFESQGWC